MTYRSHNNVRLPQRAGGEDDIDAGAMRREVAMREGEARRFATWKMQPCATNPIGWAHAPAIGWRIVKVSSAVCRLSIFLENSSAWFPEGWRRS